jgi:hypothetical protein
VAGIDHGSENTKVCNKLTLSSRAELPGVAVMKIYYNAVSGTGGAHL